MLDTPWFVVALQKYLFTGVHYNNFLLVNESNALDIQEHNNSNYPEEVLFSVEDLDTMGMYINS